MTILCSGVPVIGATGSCLEEAGGDAALYADPDSAGAERIAYYGVQFTDLTRAHWGYFQIMEATNAHDYTKSNGTENWR